jgi:hypothetical protein
MTTAPATTNSARTLWLSPKKWGNDDIHSYSLKFSARSVPLGPMPPPSFSVERDHEERSALPELTTFVPRSGSPSTRRGACASGRDLGMNSKNLGRLFHAQNCTKGVAQLDRISRRTWSGDEPSRAFLSLLFQGVPLKGPLLSISHGCSGGIT